MEHDKKISIEVAYAKPDTQKIISVRVPDGTTIHDAILHSGILQLFPEIDLAVHTVGIFSKPKILTDFVQEGERIEIYRPLTIDPKEARKKRAVKKIKK